MGREGEELDPGENFTHEGVLYDCAKVLPYAETLPIEEVPPETLRYLVGPNDTYWDLENGEKLGPHSLLSNWEEAKVNPLWQEHVMRVQNANTEYPLWLSKDGKILNGVHRLTRALLERQSSIKVRVLENLPESARTVTAQ